MDASAVLYHITFNADELARRKKQWFQRYSNRSVKDLEKIRDSMITLMERIPDIIRYSKSPEETESVRASALYYNYEFKYVVRIIRDKRDRIKPTIDEDPINY